MGPVAEVTAVAPTGTHRMEAEDTARVLLRFANGAVGAIVASTPVYPGFRQQLEITGTDGTVIIEDSEITQARLRDGTAAPSLSPTPATPSATCRLCHSHH